MSQKCFKGKVTKVIDNAILTIHFGISCAIFKVYSLKYDMKITSYVHITGHVTFLSKYPVVFFHKNKGFLKVSKPRRMIF